MEQTSNGYAPQQVYVIPATDSVVGKSKLPPPPASPSRKKCYSSDSSSSDGEGSTTGGESDSSTPPSASSLLRECDERDSFACPSPVILDEELSREVGRNVIDGNEFTSVPALIHARIEQGLEKGSFLVCNLYRVAEQFRQWQKELPMVQPFYGKIMI